jgi:sporulation protein YlmC with PRC-barrel domain
MAPVKLSRSDVVIEDPLGDLRGWQIVTADDERFGTVEDLLIDPRAKKILFLEIDAEAPDGISRHKVLIPVQVVDRVDEHLVYLRCARQSIATVPTYNPHILQSETYLREVYEHFGCPLPGMPETETLLQPDAGSVADDESEPSRG